jgi:hypothetical protein
MSQRSIVALHLGPHGSVGTVRKHSESLWSRAGLETVVRGNSKDARQRKTWLRLDVEQVDGQCGLAATILSIHHSLLFLSGHGHV